MRKFFGSLVVAVCTLMGARAFAGDAATKQTRDTVTEITAFAGKQEGTSSGFSAVQLWMIVEKRASGIGKGNTVVASWTSVDASGESTFVQVSAGVPDEVIRVVSKDPLIVELEMDFASLAWVSVIKCAFRECSQGTLADLPATDVEFRWELEKLEAFVDYAGSSRNLLNGDRFTVRYFVKEGSAVGSGRFLGEEVTVPAPSNEPIPVIAGDGPIVIPPALARLTWKEGKGSFPPFTTSIPQPIQFLTGRVVKGPLGSQ